LANSKQLHELSLTFESALLLFRIATMDVLPVYASFNFGPVSARDNILYTCLRPGYNKKDKDLTYQEQLDQMEDWVQQQITNVIALLDDNELLLRRDAPQIYLRDLYTNWEIQFLIQPIKGDYAYKNIMEYIDNVAKNNGRVIVHCASGAGRAGLVAAGWLVYK
jgi:Cyclin-dependent kinase inhibitor 3 (CDKN3)